LFGGNADEQESPHTTLAHAGAREKIMMDKTVRERLLIACEQQIRELLEEGGE
jgi:hypothetical protein